MACHDVDGFHEETLRDINMNSNPIVQDDLCYHPDFDEQEQVIHKQLEHGVCC